MKNIANLIQKLHRSKIVLNMHQLSKFCQICKAERTPDAKLSKFIFCNVIYNMEASEKPSGCH